MTRGWSHPTPLEVLFDLKLPYGCAMMRQSGWRVFIEPSAALGMGVTAWEHRKSLVPMMRKLRHWMKRGKLQVPIFGPSGAGKTTLGQFLAGELSLASGPAAYIESIGIESYKLKGDFVCSLIVPPGQERRAYTWTDLYRGISDGSVGGVINVVAYGLHSFADRGYKETTYYQPRMTKGQFVQTYLDNRRERELEIIRGLKHRLLDAKKKVWMVTLVTKQDLWWDERATVKDFYTSGEYNDHIVEITNARGAQNFAHEYLSASLVMRNLGTDKGELLVPTTRGYDQSIQYANLAKLLESVVEFAKR